MQRLKRQILQKDRMFVSIFRQDQKLIAAGHSVCLTLEVVSGSDKRLHIDWFSLSNFLCGCVYDYPHMGMGPVMLSAFYQILESYRKSYTSYS